MPLKVDTTALEAKVRETKDIEPNERLVVLTDVPERKNTNTSNDNNAPNKNNNDDDDDAYDNATPTRFSIPWNSATLSQMINLSKENFYDEDLDRIIPITVPDCEADVLMMIAMYLEYYHDKPNAVGVSTNSMNNNKDSSTAAFGNNDQQEGGKPSADNDDDDDLSHGSAISQARKHTARAKDAIIQQQQQQAAAAQAPSTGAHLLERPYKPNQMEVDLATVADSEPCLDGYEKYLANRINRMSVKDAVRTVRQLLCAGFFLQMNQSFLDLAGWLLSLRMRGNNVHQIKNMMKDENIEVRVDKI